MADRIHPPSNTSFAWIVAAAVVITLLLTAMLFSRGVEDPWRTNRDLTKSFSMPRLPTLPSMPDPQPIPLPTPR